MSSNPKAYQFRPDGVERGTDYACSQCVYCGLRWFSGELQQFAEQTCPNFGENNYPVMEASKARNPIWLKQK